MNQNDLQVSVVAMEFSSLMMGVCHEFCESSDDGELLVSLLNSGKLLKGARGGTNPA